MAPRWKQKKNRETEIIIVNKLFLGGGIFFFGNIPNCLISYVYVWRKKDGAGGRMASATFDL